MKNYQDLEKLGYLSHKDGITSQAFANIKAKEMQDTGYNTEVVKKDGYFAVYVKIGNKDKSNSNLNAFQKGKKELQEKLQFVKDNNIELPTKLNKKGNPVTDRTKKTVEKAIADFKVNQ